MLTALRTTLSDVQQRNIELLIEIATSHGRSFALALTKAEGKVTEGDENEQ
jgi:hypothetical protein